MKNKITNNLLVIDGGEVKSNDGGIVEGWAIVFGSPEEPDSSSKRDFFTDESFIRGKNSFEVPLYYEHGLGLYDEEIGEAVITKEKEGWKATAQINVDSELGKKVYEAVKSESHGFSTGALNHLVKRVPQENDTNFLKRWVAGELSLTKRPAERKAIVESVKSVDGEVIYESAWAEEPAKVPVLDDKGEKIGEIEEVITKYVDSKIPSEVLILDKVGELGYVTKEDFESRINEVLDKVKEFKPSENADNKELTTLKTELESKDKELADLRTQLSDRESALTIANEKIAQLEILAGAKETITKYKGK